ncbi:hypothetical protein HD806DRAFT_525419 [Xylariaceae sp. AK1471]|nr:hypothetical protein HD806DRAFT_525419 [Xylariaceae sp. AK1471]
METPSQTMEDLREKYPANKALQNFYLQRQWPNNDDAKILGHPNNSHIAKILNAVDVTLIVVQHINSHFPLNIRKSNVENEAKNPLLRLAWMYLEDKRYQSQAQVEAQAQAKCDFIDSLQGQKDSWAQCHLSYEDMAESELMRRTFLSMNCLLLYNPTMAYRRLNDPTSWELEAFENIPRLAETSLVFWHPENCKLVNAVDRCFGVFLCPEQGIEVIYSSNCPYVIRVFVKIPDTEPATSVSFKDITTFEMDDCRLTDDGKHFKFEKFGPKKQRYNLIAAVRLRQENDSQDMDHVRLYAVNGEHIVPSGHGHKCRSKAWSFGEIGCSYMLYYVPYAHAPIFSREQLDVDAARIRQKDMKDMNDTLEKAITSRGGLSDPLDKPPRPEGFHSNEVEAVPTPSTTALDPRGGPRGSTDSRGGEQGQDHGRGVTTSSSHRNDSDRQGGHHQEHGQRQTSPSLSSRRRREDENRRTRPRDHGGDHGRDRARYGHRDSYHTDARNRGGYHHEGSRGGRSYGEGGRGGRYYDERDRRRSYNDGPRY